MEGLDPNRAEVKKAVELFLQGKSLFLHGCYGSGKTELIKLLQQSTKEESIFTIPSQLIQRFKELMQESQVYLPEYKCYVDQNQKHSGGGDKNIFESESELKHVYQHVKVLFFDDFGSHYSTEFTESILFDLFDYRYSHRNSLITVFSSNYSLDQINNAKNENTARIGSRIQEWTTSIDMGTIDYRRSEKSTF